MRLLVTTHGEASQFVRYFRLTAFTMGNKQNSRVLPTADESTSMEESDSYFISGENDQKLWCKQWKPPNQERPKCAVYICHGFGEHCMVYDGLARLLAQKYDALVFANDHLGHGRSEGEPRAYTEDFRIFIEDVNRHVKTVYTTLNQTPQTLPFYVFGHSMGGAISLLYTMKYSKNVAGLMLMSPLVDMSGLTLSLRVKTRITRLVHSFLPRQLPVAPLDFRECVSQPELAEEFDKDPYRYHGWLRMGMASELLKAINMIEKGRPEFTTPLFIGHGTNDKLCSLEASQRFVETAASEIKTFKSYENGAHALLYEIELGIRDRFIEDLFQWFEERLRISS